MAEWPDVRCWIKLINDPGGYVVAEGAAIAAPAKVIVRYVVANDSNKPAGPLTVVGSLRRNGVKVQPGGQPNVVPAQQITVQPDQIWKKEYLVSESSGGAEYIANVLGDVGNFVKEEDESNNKASRTFTFVMTL